MYDSINLAHNEYVKNRQTNRWTDRQTDKHNWILVSFEI